MHPAGKEGWVISVKPWGRQNCQMVLIVPAFDAETVGNNYISPQLKNKDMPTKY